MPNEVLELVLMEKFGWTPNQIAEITYAKMREILLVMETRYKVEEASSMAAEKMEEMKSKPIGSSVNKNKRR